MAKKKSRAQRKAEAARRREQQLAERARRSQQEAQAQHDTQAPESGTQIELEAEMEIAGRQASQIAEAEVEPQSLAPSRADVGTGEEAADGTLTRRERKRLEREREARARQSAERRQPKAPQAERQRNIVVRFLSQVVRELSRVQWPDRPHLVQASAVTLIFVGICAAYLGFLDQVFSRLVDLLIT